MLYFQPLLQVLISEELAGRIRTQKRVGQERGIYPFITTHYITDRKRVPAKSANFTSEARGAGRSKMGRVREDSLRTDVLF